MTDIILFGLFTFFFAANYIFTQKIVKETIPTLLKKISASFPAPIG